MSELNKKCGLCGETLLPSQYARRDDHLVCRNFPFCKMAEKEVDKKVACKRVFQRLVELKGRSKNGVIAPGKGVNVNLPFRDIDQLRIAENYLIEMGCLDELTKDELLKIYADEELGPKVREIFRRRRAEGDLD